MEILLFPQTNFRENIRPNLTADIHEMSRCPLASAVSLDESELPPPTGSDLLS
jgi:hypothetical protein